MIAQDLGNVYVRKNALLSQANLDKSLRLSSQMGLVPQLADFPMGYQSFCEDRSPKRFDAEFAEAV